MTYESRAENIGGLPPLPFIYRQVDIPEEAEFRMRRISSARVVGQPNEPYTNEQIIAQIERRKREQEWFYQDYWREKGLASEQVEIEVDGNPVTLYNFDGANAFDDYKLGSLMDAMKQLGLHFPEALQRLRWVLIDGTQLKSIYGDTQKFPTNGQVVHGTNAFRFFPRGVRTDIPHRIPGANNLEGTFVHETAHLIQANFQDDWRKGFQWGFCDEFPEDWEYRTPPDGDRKFPFHKQNGDMMPQFQYPVQPEQCVNYYAKLSLEEDIAESLTAYVYEPELLQSISPTKFELLAAHDVKRLEIDITARKIEREAISMPELIPTEITYYIQEPMQTDSILT